MRSPSGLLVYYLNSVGVGRICVGKDLAYQALWINITLILWGTNILPVKDEEGKPIIPSKTALVDKGIVVSVFSQRLHYQSITEDNDNRRPPPFPCSFEPRSSRTGVTINAALDEAYSTWDFV